MKEERVFIQAGEVKIEGLVDNAPGKRPSSLPILIPFMGEI